MFRSIFNDSLGMAPVPDGLVLAVTPDADPESAGMLARSLGIKLIPVGDLADDAGDLMLLADGKRLILKGNGMELCCDLTDLTRRLRPANLQREMLVKAVRIKGVDPGDMIVADATAGFGEDSMILAAAGFRVRLFEYDPVIAALLSDGLRRAGLSDELSEAAGRMVLTCGDSIKALAETDLCPDVVLLDPMFPERQKSALVKKKFQLLHQLERPCSDEEALLRAAAQAGPKKIVIKRPVKGPYLAGIKPDHSLTGKAVRYDCIVMTPGRKLFT